MNKYLEKIATIPTAKEDFIAEGVAAGVTALGAGAYAIHNRRKKLREAAALNSQSREKLLDKEANVVSAAGQAGVKLFQKSSPFTKLLKKTPAPKSAAIVKMAGYDKSSTVKKYKAFLKHFGLEPEKAWLVGDSGAVAHGVAGRTKGVEIGVDSETFSALERQSGKNRGVTGSDHSLELSDLGVTAKLQKSMVAHRGEIVGGVHAPALNTFTRPSKLSNNRYTEKANKLLHERNKKTAKMEGEIETAKAPKDTKPKAKPKKK